VTQRIDPVGPRRDVAPVDQLRILTPVERELEKERRERERRRRRPAPRPGERPPEGGGLDVRA
jgi:hypothetical protein